MHKFGGGGRRPHTFHTGEYSPGERAARTLFLEKEKYGFLQKLKPLNFAEKIKKEMFRVRGKSGWRKIRIYRIQKIYKIFRKFILLLKLSRYLMF
jgi:hypothetical protein